MLVSILDRLAETNRMVLIGGVALLVLLVVLGGYCAVTGGGGDGDDFEAVPEDQLMTFEDPTPDPLVPTPDPLVPTATPEPTAVPTPTPDIGATLQAQLDGNRDRVGRAVVLNLLDSDSVRNPYLGGADRAYLEQLGVRLWAHARAWLHLQELMYLETEEWTVESLESDVVQAGLALEAARDVDAGSNVIDVVKAYGRTLEAGMGGVREASSIMADVVGILRSPVGEAADGGPTPRWLTERERRQEVAQRRRDAERALVIFETSMSEYGCSICGELFRTPGGGG